MRVIVTYILLLFLADKAPAQDNYVFSSYGVGDGLPQSSIWSIVQDRNGFLWVGTADGLCRFDGYNFATYRGDLKDSSALAGGIYSRFYKDCSGALWVASQDGVSRYNDIKDSFKRIFYYRKKHPTDYYNCIFGEDDQYIWAGLASCGFLKIDKHTHTAIKVENDAVSRLTSTVSWMNGFIREGMIWISCGAEGCYVYDIRANRLRKIFDNVIFSLIDFNDSEALGGTRKNLVLFKKRNYSYRIINTGLQHSGSEIVNYIIQDTPSQVIFSTPGGIYTVNTRSWKVTGNIQSFGHRSTQTFIFPQCMYKDGSGNLWVGTNGDGLKKITAPFKKFRYYSSFSPRGSIVKAIYADSLNLYVGYFNNGLDVFRRNGGMVKHVDINSISKYANHVYAITAADTGHLLLHVAQSNAILSLALAGNAHYVFSDVLDKVLPGHGGVPMANNHPFLQREGNIVYTDIGDYLLSFDISDINHVVPAIVHRFDGEMLSRCFKDSRGKLWLSTLNGAYSLSPNGVVKVPLPEVVFAKSINEDADGNIWIATVRGIYVIDTNYKVLQHYSENNGLKNQFIYGILRDADGNMWFSHNKGISVYRRATKTFRHYAMEDGLQSNEFNTGAFYKARDGELFFGGINGTNSFYPREIADNPNIPNVLVTAIKLFDEPMKTDSAYWNIHALTLPYDKNSLSFEFAATEFTNSAKNRYAYMMEGLDHTWIQSGDKRFARYPAMSPGHYVFKVKASNNDGIWQERPTTVIINIVPPFWQRLWFRIIAVLACIAGTAGIIIWIQRLRHLRMIRALELQQKIQLERERISRDLHDNVGTQLSLISNNIEWVVHPLKTIGDEEKAEKLQFVNNTARDIISTLRETIWALNKQQITLEEFADKLKTFVQKQLSHYPYIQLTISEDPAEHNILGPSEALNLFRICQEAIANALKYADAAHIDIQIRSTAGKYTIVIADNGKGFNMEDVNPSIQNGLENMRYRAGEIACSLAVDTRPGNGTRVTLSKK